MKPGPSALHPSRAFRIERRGDAVTIVIFAMGGDVSTDGGWKSIRAIQPALWRVTRSLLDMSNAASQGALSWGCGGPRHCRWGAG